MVRTDRDLLIEGFAIAIALDEKAKRELTILGAWATEPVLEQVRLAIEGCGAYQAVAGKAIFNGQTGFILHSQSLALQTYYQLDRGAEEAADWLLKVLGTTKTQACLKAAVWGLSIDESADFGNGALLIPYDQLADSRFKRLIDRKAGASADLVDMPVWVDRGFYRAPQSAYQKTIADVPFICADRSAMNVFDAAFSDARVHWSLCEILGAGRPLVFAHWVEFLDPDLEAVNVDQLLIWNHAEVAPLIHEDVSISADLLNERLGAIGGLDPGFRYRLLRSANRYVLSQCRRSIVDQVLDLALAFEIAVSEKSDNAAMAWKVSVRTAQMIGGNLEQRLTNRDKVTKFYGLRNQATHGGELNEEEQTTVAEAVPLYLELVHGFLRHGKRPNWKAIEMGVSGPTLEADL